MLSPLHRWENWGIHTHKHTMLTGGSAILGASKPGEFSCLEGNKSGAGSSSVTKCLQRLWAYSLI